jgi:hypothetical protein
MKTSLLFVLFLVINLGLSAQGKTYIIEIKSATLNSVSLSWHRADGSSDADNNQPYTTYLGEYGIKGFERGKGVTFMFSGVECAFNNLTPDTEYSLFIRKQSVSADSSIWFEEYNFKTLPCNTVISNIKTEKEYANGQFIKDLLDVHITFDKVAESYELEYGIKGFEKGKGNIIASTENRFSIGNSNLKSNTKYDFYIRAKCNGAYGVWSEKDSFLTTNVFHYKGNEAFEVNFENITNKSARAQWTKIVGDAYSKYYLIEYGPKGFVRGTGHAQSGLLDILELNGLEADTEYSFFIRSNNVSSADSVWFTEHTFKTLPCNTVISGIESMEMWTTCFCDNGAVGVEIKWADMADSYKLEYGLKGFQKGTGESLMVNEGNSVFISYKQLNSYTDYDFYIQAECNGAFGEWTAKNTFSTTQLNTGIEKVQSPKFELYPNPIEDILYIKFNPTFDINSIIINVFDMKGSLVFKSGYKDNYNLSSLPAGTYIVSVKDKKSSTAMIIQKK